MTALSEFAQPEMRVEAAGYGIGRRDMGEYPNVLGSGWARYSPIPGLDRLS